MADAFFERGWATFPLDPAILDWLDAAEEAARRAVADPAHSQWHRCGGTWFAGVNALDNDVTGTVAGGLPLQGAAIRFAEKLVAERFDWDRAQVSVCYPGYPKQGRRRERRRLRLPPRPGRRPCRRAAAGRAGAPAVPARAPPLHPRPADRPGRCRSVAARRVGGLPPHCARDLCQDLRRHIARNLARCRRYRGLSCDPTAHFREMPARDRHRRKGRGLSGAPAGPPRHRALGRRRDGRGADGDLFSPRIGRPPPPGCVRRRPAALRYAPDQVRGYSG